MAREGLSRPPGGPVYGEAPPHDRWLPGRWTGVMALTLETLTDRFVSPGTGRLVLLGESPREIVAHRAERSLDQPVLPGSGIKGAVRTLYELLSFSCNPFDSHCKRTEACQACALFGARSYAGRVTFADAVPAAGEAVRSEVRNLPMGHEPHEEKTRGDFRLYDLAPGDGPQGGPPRVRAAREVYRGKFSTRLSFHNATGEEMGRLLLCLGLAGEGAAGFPLRLGGVKYDGQGAVRAAIESMTIREPRHEPLSAEAYREQVRDWIAVALGSAWGSTFRPTYEQLAATLGRGEGAR